MRVKLENKEHNTKVEVELREDIIQPGIFKDIKRHLCKCGGRCGCSQLGHTDSSHHICVCKDLYGEEYAHVKETNEEIHKD